MFSSERNELRNVFLNAWRKHLEKTVMEPLEAQLVDIILMHPEYHNLLTQVEVAEKDFPEGNPFLHLSLHMALLEQINTNRPAGIQAIHQALCIRLGDKHQAEHKMIDCLAQILWQAQKTGIAPNEQTYLETLRTL